MQYADGIIKLVNCLWTAVVGKKKKKKCEKHVPEDGASEQWTWQRSLPGAAAVEEIRTAERSQTALTANPLAAPVHVTEGSLAQHTCQHTAHHRAHVACTQSV